MVTQHRKAKRARPAKRAVTGARSSASHARMLVAGIGASAGGLEAFSELLQHLPPDTGMAFVLIQHLDPAHESALAQILTRSTRMPVLEATNDLRIQPDHVYIIPPNTSMAIERGVLKVTRRDADRTLHRSIDTFFESLAQDQNERAVGIVLSGTASDGTLGLESIKGEGGLTFAQDDSAKYDSMPRSAIAAGCVDLVLAPEGIARELARISRHPFVVEHGAPTQPEMERELDQRTRGALASGGRGAPTVGGAQAREEVLRAGRTQDDNGFKRILGMLRGHSGVDFALYKSSTIRRRITRRVVLNGNSSLEDYARVLKGNVKELNALYSDVLIGVTSFFRNPESFEVLKRTVFPRILQQRGREGEAVRVWTLGCSTGQEAYSIAIAYAEFSELHGSTPRLQIFATDLNDALLDKARQGLYAKSLAQDISPQRLRQFFVEEEGGYRVSKMLREQVVFARQNVITDPPFSRMDLISCRNLLIYLEPGLQKSIMPAFHYALRPGGFLFLGASESVGPFTNLFAAVDHKHKIFVKKATITPGFRLPLPDQRTGASPESRLSPMPTRERLIERGPGAESSRREVDAQREADRALLNQFAPPSVLINSDFQILQFRGPTGPFLEPPTGKASFDLLKMAREGLLLPLRSLLNTVRRTGKPARKDGVRVQQPGGLARLINLHILPLKNLRERCYIVLFETARPRAGEARAKASPERARPLSKRQETIRIVELERELSETREYLQAIQEDHEAANEELQASGEEVQSANEELQSINEELETSKEELESTNEELTTVNEEMANRNTELSRANADLNNLQLNMNMAVLLFSRTLTLRRFTSQAEKIFNLLATDVGRSISGIRHNLEVDHLEQILDEVIATLGTRELDVRDKEGRWFSLRARPYMTVDNTMDGVVLVLHDITERKHAEEALGRLGAIVDGSADSIVSTDLDGEVTSWNRGAEQLYGHPPRATVGRPIAMIVPPGREQEASELLERVRGGESIHQLATVRRRKDGGLVEVSLTASPIKNSAGEVVGVAEIHRDMTDQRRAQKEREDLLAREQAARDEAVAANHAKDLFLATLGHEVRSPLNAILGWATLLRSGQPSAGDLRKGMEVIERNCRIQARLVDDVLDVAGIMSGKLRLELKAADLSGIIQAAIDTVRADAEGRQIEIQARLDDGARNVIADAGRLQQAIWNLLSNAIKFTPRGGRVAVASKRDGGAVVVAVSDTGRGIRAEFLPVIFERFRQVDGNVRGLGLGLSIVRHIVELHGGKVEAQSDGENQGATFKMRLPILAEAAAHVRRPDVQAVGPARPDQEAPPRLDGLHAVVVDDEEDARDLLQRVLEGAGATVESYGTASDAVKALGHDGRPAPGVLISDIQMPDLNGFDLIRQLRRNREYRTLPAIALTAFAHEGNLEQALDAGYQAHLLKPVDPWDLLAAVADVVAARAK